MEHIYSKFYQQNKMITAPKSEILGVVLHDDAENYAATDYIDWLQNRIEHDELEKGWACVYVDKNTCYWFHPSEYIEWHCGHTFANAHYIGIERCQSKIDGILSDEAFMRNEEASFKIAAMLLQKYKLPVNRSTVKLHKMFYNTACPARAWAIHLKNGPTNQQNIQRLQDYFIKKIQAYDVFTEEELAVLG